MANRHVGLMITQLADRADGRAGRNEVANRFGFQMLSSHTAGRQPDPPSFAGRLGRGARAGRAELGRALPGRP